MLITTNYNFMARKKKVDDLEEIDEALKEAAKESAFDPDLPESKQRDQR